jgi:hypothetical protein
VESAREGSSRAIARRASRIAPRRAARRGHLRDAGRLRLAITVVFGLIHGFGFAAGLLEFKMPQDRLAELLVGFNLGVEVGQLSVVLVLLALVSLLRRLKLALPRPVSSASASTGSSDAASETMSRRGRLP